MQYQYFWQILTHSLSFASLPYTQTAVLNNLAFKKTLPKQDGGYSIRFEDGRYEGIYNKEKAEEDFRVFSLLSRELEYIMTAKETLTIITYELSVVDAVFIAGISFNIWPDYRLNNHLKLGYEAHVPLGTAIRSYQSHA